MLIQQDKKTEELEHRLDLLQKENERLGRACDDADEEVSDLKQQIFELLRVNAKLQAEMVCFSNKKMQNLFPSVFCFAHFFLNFISSYCVSCNF